MAKVRVAPLLAPPILGQVPKDVVRALDMFEVFRNALTATKHLSEYGPVIALRSLESYLNEAKRVQRRMKRARATVWERRKPNLGDLVRDAHFYLICWARITKLAKFIASSTRFRRTGLVLRRYRAELEERILARDHFEHFEERLPGGRNRYPLPAPNDLCNMWNEYLSYGGRRLDVGPASIRLLATIVDEFRKALFFDSIEKLEATDKDRLTALLEDANRVIHVARITKKMEKIWRSDEGATAVPE